MKKSLTLLVFGILLTCSAYPQVSSGNLSLIENATISGEWFLGFGYNDNENISTFNLKRGYFTIRTSLNDNLSVRYTQDITTDTEGSDIGNVEMRLKYLLLRVDLKNIGFLKNSFLEFGLVHRPWLEYEQKLTGYRVQGKMFTERYDLISSADFGISFAGLIGGEIDQEYQEKVSSYFPGRYGSFCFGVYNGGGYHALEKNNNKIIEGRITIRPLPDFMPGFQMSYTFSYGKSNTASNNADYRLNIFHLATESHMHKLMLQYYIGLGGHNGDNTDPDGLSYSNEGYFGFAEISIPGTKFSVFSRYDKLISYQDNEMIQETFIAGLTYRFLRNKVLLNYDQNEYLGNYTRIYELALEVNF
ncbi:MAG: hypothetical protein JW965_03520 [Bacteroidales bacterium]|nr:hypothetical protein [Bacteroidales bacterium]